MAYGELKVDSITFTDGGSDATVSVSGLVKNPTFSGNIVVNGNISGTTITGDSAGFGSVTGVTVTGTTANFVSGVFTSQVSGAVITGNTAGFTTVTGTTITGTTANFVTVSGTTVTGDAAQFTSVTGGTAGFTTVTGTTVTGTTANFVTVSGTAITGNTAGFTTVTGTTVTGTTANFNTVSGTTVTGGTGNFTSISATTTTITSGVFASGTAAAPSVSVGTTDNGLYSPGTDQVAISTNGTGRLFVDASGNVGVGITNPSEILDVNGKGLFDQLKVNTNVITTTTDIELTSNAVIRSVDSIRNVVNTGGFFGWNIGGTDASAGTSGSSEVARIDSSGRLGLGTSSPAYLLDVDSNYVRFGNTSGVGLLQLGASSTASQNFHVGATGSTVRLWNGDIGSGTELLRITPAGKVGIGTTSPNEILHLSSSDSVIRITTNRNDTTFNNSAIVFDSPRSNSADGDTHSGRGLLSCLGNSSGTGGIVWLQTASAALDPQESDADLKTNQCGIRLQSDGSLEHWASSSQRIKVDSSGRLLVGTSSDITGNTATSIQAVQPNGPATSVLGRSGTSIGNDQELGRIHFYSTGGDGATWEIGASIAGVADGTHATGDKPTRLVFSVTEDGNSSPTTSPSAMTINNAQEVLIGYSSDNGAYKLQVNSQIFATSATIATSDGRYKENIATLDGCLDLVKALRPVSFTWKPQQTITQINDEGEETVVREPHNFPEGTQVGFIAQEVQEVLEGKPWLGSVIKENVRPAVKDNDGNELAPEEQFYGIAEGNLIAVLTNALQEAVGRIETLEAEVAALKS